MPVTAVARLDPAVCARLLASAGAGDERAWAALFSRFDPVIRGIARRYRLNDADQEEVGQRTWLRLFLHVDDVRDPAALPGWLATTARHEALRVLTARRDVPLAQTPEPAGVAGAAADELYAAAERRCALRVAMDALPDRQRALLQLFVDEPALSYDEVGQALGMPRGSIGPTRRRSLSRLRRDAELRQAVT